MAAGVVEVQRRRPAASRAVVGRQGRPYSAGAGRGAGGGAEGDGTGAGASADSSAISSQTLVMVPRNYRQQS